MFIIMIVLLTAATEALYNVKMLSIDKMVVDYHEIIAFENASVSRKEVWDKVNESEYVTFRKINSHIYRNNHQMILQVITPGKSETIDSKTATEDLVQIEGAEIFLKFESRFKYYVATILDMEGNMVLDYFIHIQKTATVKQIWHDAKNMYRVLVGLEHRRNVYGQSIWKSVIEIRVEAPGHATQIITTQTPDDTKVQVENAKYFVATFSEIKLNTELQHLVKAHKYTGIFRSKDTSMFVPIKDIWDAATQEVYNLYSPGENNSSYSHYNASMWKCVTEIRVELPGQDSMTITKQTPENKKVQVKNANCFVKLEAEEGVKHMAPFWVAEQKHGAQHPMSYKYTGVFRFKDNHFSAKDIYDTVEKEKDNESYPPIITQFRIEMLNSTINAERKWNRVRGDFLKTPIDWENKIDVTTITDVIIIIWGH